MNIYTKRISEITSTVEKIPRVNKSVRKKFLSPEIYNAGMEFLNSIHKEEPSIGATQEELQEEQNELKQKQIDETSPEKVEPPELTLEYLKSIGLERYATWGSN